MVNKKPYEQIKFSVKPYQQYRNWTRSPSSPTVLQDDESSSVMTHYPLDESNTSMSGSYGNSNIDNSLSERSVKPNMIGKSSESKIGSTATNSDNSSGKLIYDNTTNSNNTAVTELAVDEAILVAAQQSQNMGRSNNVDERVQEPRNVKKQKLSGKNVTKNAISNENTNSEFLLMDSNSFASKQSMNKVNNSDSAGSNSGSNSNFKIMSGSINISESYQMTLSPLYHILHLKEINSQITGPHSLVARNSVKIWIQNRLQHLGIHLAIERSDDKKVVLRCRNKNHDTSSTKVTKGIINDSMMHNNNCMFKIRANFSKKQQKWNISIINDKHNHYLVSELRLFPEEDPYYSHLYLQNNNGIFIDEMNTNGFEETIPKIPENSSSDNDKKHKEKPNHNNDDEANSSNPNNSSELDKPKSNDSDDSKINKNQNHNNNSFKNNIYNSNNGIQDEPNFNLSYNFSVNNDTRNSNMFSAEIPNNIINDFPKYEKTNSSDDYGNHLIGSQGNNNSISSLNPSTKEALQYHCKINMDNKSLPLYVSVEGKMFPLYRNSNGYFIKK